MPAAACGGRACYSPPVCRAPIPSDLKLRIKGTFSHIYCETTTAPAEAAAPCKVTLQVLDLNKIQESMNPMDKQKYRIPSQVHLWQLKTSQSPGPGGLRVLSEVGLWSRVGNDPDSLQEFCQGCPGLLGCFQGCRDAARDSQGCQRLSGLQLCLGLEERLRLAGIFGIGRGLRTGRDTPGCGDAPSWGMLWTVLRCVRCSGLRGQGTGIQGWRCQRAGQGLRMLFPGRSRGARLSSSARLAP